MQARELRGLTVDHVAFLAACEPEDVVCYELGARFPDRPAALDGMYVGLRLLAESDRRRAVQGHAGAARRTRP